MIPIKWSARYRIMKTCLEASLREFPTYANCTPTRMRRLVNQWMKNAGVQLAATYDAYDRIEWHQQNDRPIDACPLKYKHLRKELKKWLP